MPKPGVVSDPGTSSEVGERLVVSSAEESEVSPLGEVGVGLRECSGVLVGSKLASRVDKAKSEVVGKVSSVVGDVLGTPAVPSCFEVESGVSCEPEGPGDAEEPGDEVVGCSSRRSGFGFLGEPGGEGKGEIRLV